MKHLSPRQQSILNRIVETHIETAQPVGSRALTDLYTGIYQSSYSPATVRMEMGQLEEMGFLTHPHTSAGRIPTDQGYRYYVDHGLKEETPSEGVVNRISHELAQAGQAAEMFADEASRILSQLTDEVSLIVVSDSRRSRPRLFFQGSSRMLEKPEFQDINRIRPILETLEEKNTIAEWLMSRVTEKEVSVSIGRENEPQAFRCCSLIATRYAAGRKISGTVAVLGPRRMKYSRTLPLVAQMAKMMRAVFENDNELL
jgi:transcriptional regulator of heat shock response